MKLIGININLNFVSLTGLLLIIACDTNEYSFKIEKFRPELQEQILKIEKHNGIMVWTNESMTNGEVYESLFTQTRDLCTKHELRMLINHKNPIMRTMGYDGLLRLENRNRFYVLNLALQDTAETVEFTYGCLDYTKYIGEYIVEQVYGSEVDKDQIISYERRRKLEFPKELHLSESQANIIVKEYRELRRKSVAKW